MERRYYNAESLRRDLDALEARYGMSSEEFFADERVDAQMSGFDRHVWASLYQDWQRLSAQ